MQGVWCLLCFQKKKKKKTYMNFFVLITLFYFVFLFYLFILVFLGSHIHYFFRHITNICKNEGVA
jgi:hypothetical protein